MIKRLVIAGLIFVAFSVNCFAAGTPTEAVKKFCDAVMNDDYVAMADAATSETILTVAMFGSKAKVFLVAEKIDFRSLAEQIDGDTAVVTYATEEGGEGSFHLVKINGDWNVDLHF
jgi:hypothetical protein